MPMVEPAQSSGQAVSRFSILLASDSERLGSSLQGTLREHGFHVTYAGNYEGLESHLVRSRFDMVLLEVTGDYAVEPAVEAALRVKRVNAGQFVGYLADSSLDAKGLAGDGIFPRSAARLPSVLRSFIAGDNLAFSGLTQS